MCRPTWFDVDFPYITVSKASISSPWPLGRKTCIVAMIPVSVPLSILIFEEILSVSYRCSKYQQPITLGSELPGPIFKNSYFGLTVSIHQYTTSGKVLFWNPMSFACPSREWTQFGQTVVNCPFTRGLFLFANALCYSLSGSMSYIMAWTILHGTLRLCSCLIFLVIAR